MLNEHIIAKSLSDKNKSIEEGLPARCANEDYCNDAPNFRKAPYFALHKGIAIGFLRATGFRNKPKRTIFYFWCGDPNRAARMGPIDGI